MTTPFPEILSTSRFFVTDQQNNNNNNKSNLVAIITSFLEVSKEGIPSPYYLLRELSISHCIVFSY